MSIYRGGLKGRMRPWERLVDNTVEMAQDSARWAVPLAVKRMEILESLALMKRVGDRELKDYFREKELKVIDWARAEMDDPTFQKRALDWVRFKMNSVNKGLR